MKSKGKPKEWKDLHPTVKSIEAMNSFVDQGMRLLTPSEIALWFVLLRATKWEQTLWEATASHTYLQEKSGLSEKTVKRSMKGLKDKGFILVLKRGNKGEGCSVYRIFGKPMTVNPANGKSDDQGSDLPPQGG